MNIMYKDREKLRTYAGLSNNVYLCVGL